MPVRAERPGHVWTYDFLKDQCENGQALRVLTLVDEFTRECLAIEVGASIGARRVITVLERVFAEHGPPEWLRSDNGPEFIAGALKRWLAEKGSRPRYIDPGCPRQNPYGESFNGRLRDECLNLELFAHRQEPAVILEDWRREYNQERPQSNLGYRTPREFRAAWDGGSHGAEHAGQHITADPTPLGDNAPGRSAGSEPGRGIYRLHKVGAKLEPDAPLPPDPTGRAVTGRQSSGPPRRREQGGSQGASR